MALGAASSQDSAVPRGAGGEGAGQRSLAANFSWTLAGNATSAAALWGILILLTRVGGEEAAGQYAIALALAAPMFMFSDMGLRAALATDASDAFRFGDYFRFRLLSTACCVLLVLCTSGVRLWLGHGFEACAVLAVVGLGKGLDSMSDILYGLLQKHERMDLIGRSMAMRDVAALALSFLFVLERSVLLVVALILATKCAVVLLYDARNARRLLRREAPRVVAGPVGSSRGALAWGGPRALGRLALVGLPLGVTQSLGSLFMNVPKYAVEGALGSRMLGAFSCIFYVVEAGMRVVAALGQAASARLARSWLDGGRVFARLLARLVAVTAGVGVLCFLGALVAGRPMLRLVFGPAIARHSEVLVLFAGLLPLLLSISLLDTGMTAVRKLFVQPIVRVIAIGVLWLASFVLIARYSLVGAAIAVGCGAVVQVAGSVLVLWSAARSTNLPAASAGGDALTAEAGGPRATR